MTKTILTVFTCES